MKRGGKDISLGLIYSDWEKVGFLMPEKIDQITGGCMCGAVRYICNGEPMTVAYCHCDECRNHSGAPAVVWVAYDTEQVRYDRGTPDLYESSPGVKRGFCGNCGTPMTWQAESVRFSGRHITEFYVGTLDEPSVVIPDRHWFESERIEWFDTIDNLPRYERLDGPGLKAVHVGSKKS